MNKNFKILHINGLMGLLFLCFILSGIICGFVLFPIWMIMTGWNATISDNFAGPQINYIQSALLWGIVAILFYLKFKNRLAIKIQKADAIDIDELEKNIMENSQTEESASVQELTENEKSNS